MPVNIGVNIQRSPNRINQQLREAGVEGKFPKLLLDFKDEYYLASGGSKTLANAVTHARAGNATMTDGYGDDLIDNPSFSDTSFWTTTAASPATSTIANGVATIVSPAGESATCQANILTVGKAYEITAKVKVRSGSCKVQLGSGATAKGSKVFSSSGTYTFVRECDGIDGVFFLARNNACDVDFDDISVREIPVLKWAPHNLLAYSEDLGNWTNFNTTDSLNQIASPDGTTTADKVVENSSSTVHNIYQTGHTNVVSGVDYTFCTFVKQGEYKWIQLSFALSNSTFTANDFANFDVNAGTVGTTGSGATATIEDVGSGWYKCSVTATAAASASSGATICLTDNTNASSRNPSYAGDGSSGIYVWGMHFNRGDLGGMVDNPERGDSYVPTALRPFGANLVTNGTFDTDFTGWTDVSTGTGSIAVVSGQAQLTRVDLNNRGFISQAITVVSGAVYELKITQVSGSAYVAVGNSPTATTFLGQALETGENTFHFVPTDTSVYVNVRGIADGTQLIDNISVRQSTVRPDTARYLPRVGHHVYNGSAWVNEGLLAESESRTNLAPDSDMSSANLVGATRTADAAVSPDGTQNAFELTASSTAPAYIRYSGIFTASQSYAVSIYAKAGTNDIIRIANDSSSVSGQWFDLTNGTLLTSNGANNTATIQNVGNGWYRCTRYFDSVTTNSSGEIFVGNSDADGSTNAISGSTVYLFGFQIENNATSSSFIPTSGSTVSRAAETFTIPSANLPWPSPQYIGSELVTNGTFDTDTTGWTAQGDASISSVNGELQVADGGASFSRAQLDLTPPANKVYRVSVDARLGTATSYDVRIGNNLGTTVYGSATSQTATKTHVFYVYPTTALLYIFLYSNGSGGNETAFFDNISVREINPLSVSIAMDGRMTYADEDDAEAVVAHRWEIDGGNRIRFRVATNSTKIGDPFFDQSDNSVSDTVTGADDTYAPGVLVPYNAAGRHGSTFINGATDGVSLTANTTPTALPDLSATDLNLAYDYMGTIGTFRVWDKDIADTGLVEATNPSLEPSLSLTFEGVGTNSFVVNDWSE